MKRFLLAAAMLALPSAALADHDGKAAADAYAAANDKMMMAMHGMTPTGNADRDFVTLMIPHHQAAIDMARIEIEYGHDAALKAMAHEIIAAQEKEIGAMQAWLCCGAGTR